MEARAADELSGFHGRSGGAPALLGAQHDRLAAASATRGRTAPIARWLAWRRWARSELLLTQNVDRLHQAAGSTRVIDLHGRLDQVRCMGCERLLPRAAFQDELSRLNPSWLGLEASQAPDGDADIEVPSSHRSSSRLAFIAASC